MAPVNPVRDRRTSVDEIFEDLYDEIASLRLKPGDKISEAEVAAKFGVSRQPVRDAFSRLHNLDLVVIRPQRATEVKRFSSKEITKSRFVRAAVEVEVLRRAAERCDEDGAALLDACLERQAKAIADSDYERFGELDYEFHKTLCQVADADFAFEVIAMEKGRVDRLCLLSMSKEDRMPQLIEDHHTIAQKVRAHDADGAVAAGRVHLSRLDSTIDLISRININYFEGDAD